MKHVFILCNSTAEFIWAAAYYRDKIREGHACHRIAPGITEPMRGVRRGNGVLCTVNGVCGREMSMFAIERDFELENLTL